MFWVALACDRFCVSSASLFLCAVALSPGQRPSLSPSEGSIRSGCSGRRRQQLLWFRRQFCQLHSPAVQPRPSCPPLFVGENILGFVASSSCEEREFCVCAWRVCFPCAFAVLIYIPFVLCCRITPEWVAFFISLFYVHLYLFF